MMFALQLRGPFGVGVSGKALTYTSLSVPSFQHVLILFTVFKRSIVDADLYSQRVLLSSEIFFLSLYNYWRTIWIQNDSIIVF